MSKQYPYKLRVRAIAQGFYNNRIIKEDQEFSIAVHSEKDRNASWYLPVEDEKKVNAPKDSESNKPKGDVPADEKDAVRFTNPQLKAILDERGIEYVGNAPKADLIRALFAKANAQVEDEGDKENDDDIV